MAWCKKLVLIYKRLSIQLFGACGKKLFNPNHPKARADAFKVTLSLPVVDEKSPDRVNHQHLYYMGSRKRNSQLGRNQGFLIDAPAGTSEVNILLKKGEVVFKK